MNAPSQPRTKILVVEAQAAIASEIETRLAEMGYQVIGPAASAERALHLAESQQPDIALMDVQLAGETDGIETAALLRSRFDIPTVYLTTFSDETAVERGKTTHPLGYLIKPFTHRDLRATLDLAVHRLGVDRELARYRNELESRVASRTAELEQANRRLAAELEERKHAENTLTGFRAGLDIHAIVTITDTEGRITYANDNFCAVCRFSREELLGNDHRLINSGYHDKAFIRAIWDTLRQGRAWHGELCNRAKDGTLYWVDATMFPLVQPDGTTQSFVSISTDITQRKSQEEALRERESLLSSVNANLEHLVNERTRELADKASRLREAQRIGRMGSWELDLTTNQLTWSEEIFRIFEIDPTRFGTSYEAFLQTIHPDDRNLVDQAYRESVEHHGVYDLVHRLLMPDGRIKYVRERCETTYDSHGAPRRSAGTVQDITELRQTEQALVASEENYRQIFDAATDAIFVHDANTGAVLDINQAMLDLYGFTREEALQLKPDDSSAGSSPYSSKEVAQWMVKAKTEGPQVFEWLARRKSGETFWVEVALKAATISGQPRILAVVRDATERKRAAAALEASNHRLRIALSAVRMGAWEARFDPPSLVWSDEIFSLFGLPKQPVSLEFFRSFLHPEDREVPEAAMRRATETRSLYYAQFRVVVGGRIYWVEDRGEVSFSPDGRPVGAVGIAIDITERKETEALQFESLARFSGFAQASQYGMGMADLDGHILYVNPALARMLGESKPESCIGRIFHTTYYPPEISRRLQTEIIPTLLDQGHWHGELEVLTADGRRVPTDENYFVIRDQEGRPRYIADLMTDITERKQAEEARRESFALLESVVEHAPVRVFWKNSEGRYLGCNSLFARDAGATRPADVIGKTDFDLGWKDQAEQYRADDQAVLRSGRPKLGYEEPQTTPDGTALWLRTSKVPLIGAHNETIGILGIYEDITEQKRAESTLRKEETFRRSVIERASEGLCVCHAIPDFPFVRFTVWNERMVQITGYSLDDINRLGWYQSVYPDPAYRERAIARMDQMRHGKDLILEEWDITRADGQQRTLAISTSILPGEDGLTHVLTLMSDVTARKRAERELAESEAKFRALTEESLVGIYLIQDGRFLYANKTHAQLLGYTRKELLALPSVLETIVEEDRPRVIEHTRRRLAGEVASTRYEFSVRRKDGSRRTVEVLGSYTEFGGKPAILGTAMDVTDRRELESQMLRKQRLESLGTLAGGVAHDLNNALAPILMVTEIMRAELPQNHEMLTLVESSAKRGAEMVKQLLTFARGVEGERTGIQSTHLLREIERIIRGTFPKNLRLQTRYEPELRIILGDATQLHQVLLNLCVNARDAMPHGGTLTLEAFNADIDEIFATTLTEVTPGRYVVWRVRDTGVGIPPENIERIFDPFFSTKAPDTGTGLGLSTVLGVVRSHGGFIQVQSTPGKGSDFTIYFPALAEESETLSARPATPLFHGNGETILFADDEPSIRDAATTVLKRLNFTPVTATDGADGVARAAQHLRELRAIITDLHMPHMDGLSFVRVVRRMRPDIPIAVASGRIDNTILKELEALGVTHRLDKPFTEAALADTLRQMLPPVGR